MATGCPHHLHRMSNPFLGADFSSSKCYGQLVTSLYFNLISSAPSQLHTFAVFLSPDFFKKMMAINLDLLLPSAPKKCPNCRTKKIKLEGKRGDDGEDKKEKGDVCFMEIVKWWLKMTLQPFGWMVVKYDSYFTFKQNYDIFYTFFFSIETGNLMNSIICNRWGVEQTLCFGLVKQVRIRKMHLLRVLNGKKKWSDVRYD